ncbi:MAG: hypothetical protein ACFFD4_30800 [Candidatus Odinarchaeota archaeon]
MTTVTEDVTRAGKKNGPAVSRYSRDEVRSFHVNRHYLTYQSLTRIT